jgi:hypothetical protein
VALTASPPKSFIRPSLPATCAIEGLTASGTWEGWLGPFRREDAHFEADGALVLFEDGALPARFGVVRVEGDVCDLWPRGQVRFVAARMP